MLERNGLCNCNSGMLHYHDNTLEAENIKLREEVEQLKACLSSSEEARDANFKAKDRAFLQIDGLMKVLKGVDTVFSEPKIIDTGHGPILEVPYEVAAGVRGAMVNSALKPIVPVPICAACHGAFPGHQPGCPFGYDQPE